MSVKVMALVFESDLPPTQRLIMLALANYANDQGRHIYPSVGTVARITGLTKRAVQANLRKLEAAGYVVNTGERTKHGVIIYEVSIERLLGDESDSPPSDEGRIGFIGGMNQIHPGGDTDSPNPSSIRQLSERWTESRAILKLALDPGIYEMYPHQLRCTGWGDGTVTLQAPNDDVRAWCELRMRKQILLACSTVDRDIVSVEFVNSSRESTK